ncbi:MAG: DUF3795 domain-containing protein [Candidatus Helarchaeota archaeon]
MTYDKKEVTPVEKAFLGKCGVFCGACDAYLGDAKAYAKELFDSQAMAADEKRVQKAAQNLLNILEQFNYDDLICFVDFGIKIKQYEEFKRFLKVIAEGKLTLEEDFDLKAFQRVLRKFVEAPKCTGCGIAGAARMCPIVLCCQEKGYLTCAECPDIVQEGICNTINEKIIIPSLITDNKKYFQLITQRYSHWNVENLKKIIRKGYKQYISEMRAKCAQGFTVGQIICKDYVFRELLGF